MPGKIAGQIVEVSPEGNLITDIGHDQLRSVPTDLSVRVSCDEHFTRGIFWPITRNRSSPCWLPWETPAAWNFSWSARTQAGCWGLPSASP